MGALNDGERLTMFGRGIGKILSAVALAAGLICGLAPAALSQTGPTRFDAPIVVAQAGDPRARQRGQRAAPPYDTRPGAVSLFERQPPPSTGFSLRRLFGLDEPPPPQAPPPAYRPRPRPKPVVRQERAKPQAENRIVVFGDWLADGLALGLDESFADMANIAVARRTRAETGLLREEWPKIVTDYLNQKQKITVAVISLGMADRSGAPAGGTAPEPLSDAWKELYGQRIDALMAVFAARNVPVVWVGLPPVKDTTVSARYAAINAVLRDRVGHSGVYVDIWPGFVDEDNRYVAAGPDAGGQTARLRASDGVHFTRKGVNKIAAYAAVEIRRMLNVSADAKDVPTALPGSGNEPFADIDKSVLPPSEPGPPVPLTRAEVSPGGVLLKGRTDLNAAGDLYRAFRAGLPTAPVKGRMDDPAPISQ